MSQSNSRRDFMKTSGAAIAAGTMPYWFTSPSARANSLSVLERPVIGCVGTGDRWKAVVKQAFNVGDIAAVCDVDANHLAEGLDIVTKAQSSKGNNRQVDTYEDYRKVIDRKDIDLLICVTPDHWHTKVSIEGMKSGKDVYCEKPLTLTIDEGKQICQVLTDTKRVFQVGTQQRTEMNKRFLYAVAIIRAGRIGNIKKVTCAIGPAPTSESIPVKAVPKNLNWDMWLGQAPFVDYRDLPGEGKWGKSRCHYEFRWWYEYSGGKMTDWGAHHVDIAMWGLDRNGPGQGPKTVEVVSVNNPVPLKDGWPTLDDRYNVAANFNIKCMFADGVQLNIVDNYTEADTDFVVKAGGKAGFGNGILFEGDKGTLFVSRSDLTGSAVEELKTNPLPAGALETVYGGPVPDTHMQNLVESIVSRKQPISDVYTHHRAMTVCHLANIAIRLDRKIQWDSAAEMIVGDDQAKAFMSREQRKGYEIHV
jgi:predicted dehydrogenase